MIPCPLCGKQLRRFNGWQPGEMTVCADCGCILRVAENFAMRPATGAELDAQPRPYLTHLLESSCRVMRYRIERERPPTPKPARAAA